MYIIRGIFIVAVMACFCVQASAERVALVMGNAQYERAQDLPQTAADARAMADKLSELGFRLVGDQAHIDLSRSAMLAQLRALEESIESDDDVVVYFSGHGIGGTQTNYLLPTDDGFIRRRQDVQDHALDVNSILARLPRRGGTNVLILDACRDNPLPSEAKSSFSNKGLSRVSAASSNTIFLYAAKPGEKAYVSESGRSYFTDALLRTLNVAGLEADDVIRNVSADVVSKTRDRPQPQRPWMEGFAERPFVFHKGAALLCGGLYTEQAAQSLWRSVQMESSPERLNDFADTCFDTKYADAARRLAASLTNTLATPDDRPPFVESQSDTMSAAAKSLQRECVNGDNEKCVELAYDYEIGDGVEADYGRALELYTRGCEGDVSRGCANAGWFYFRGIGVQRDYAKSKPFFEKGCDGDRTSACSNLGELYQNGWGVIADQSRAISFFEKACNLGGSYGCGELGWHYATGRGISKDVLRASELYQIACDGNEAFACTNLGMLERDEGDAASLNTSVSLFSKACDLDYARGCASLGWNYFRGLGVSQDYTSARPFLEKGCDGDNSSACSNLGELYQNGWGVIEDQPRAVSLFRKSCDLGSGYGCNELGWHYDVGQGVDENHFEARRLYELACDRNDALGCSNAALLYGSGQGGSEDSDRARSLYSKACSLGDSESCGKAG